ncbi:MAG: deoxyguanosinetriphosphate triphosphohydrolase [Actinobacteria bacterium]|nr:deoxyguanosinetriphosphate triphosphohydrolase [Actinomycetota bacterium]MCB9413306.1 deoxyguanosinetriphosphate triphosphohydrolase [Actinomycetota bacterium]
MRTSEYSSADAERRAPERPKRPVRDPFRRDRARVLHSWALRRLADKTQVLLPGESDFPRTRLTHTLEVSQVAREMGDELGCDPDIVDTAGLCHDLGHPPFGHNGESALDSVAAAIGGFEGNAQSFRVLTRLEPKVIVKGRSMGLNLTRASLDAMLKYPWFRRPDSVKFNAYADDAEAFEWVRRGAPVGRPSLEAQVMDWADDVAYSVHDVEDALYSGFISPEQLQPGPEMERVVAVAAEQSGPEVDVADVVQAHARLRALPQWPTAFDHTSSSLAALKAFTSTMIGRLSAAAVDHTLAAAAGGPVARYQADLVVPREQRAEVALLKAVSSHFVFNRPGVSPLYDDQRALLIDLVSVLREGAPDALHPMFAELWREAPGEEARFRVVIDQVASLTDVSAVRWHRRLVG